MASGRFNRWDFDWVMLSKSGYFRGHRFASGCADLCRSSVAASVTSGFDQTHPHYHQKSHLFRFPDGHPPLAAIVDLHRRPHLLLGPYSVAD